MTDAHVDAAAFLSDRFDVHAYANAVLAGKPYRPDDEDKGAGSSSKGKGRAEERGDVGVELAKLNHGIEDVTKQLRQEITASYPILLTHLTTSLALSSQIAPIRSSLTPLSTSLERLHGKIHTPHAQLSLLVRRMHLLAQVSDLTRRAARFVLVSRRMEAQMERMKKAAPSPMMQQGATLGQANGAATGTGVGAGLGKGIDRLKDLEGERERELAKAALSVAELDALLRPHEADDEDVRGDTPPLPLQSLDFVKAYEPAVNKARDTIIQEMESMVISGLGDLNQPLLSSSLQTAHNLRLLPDLVSNLLADLNDAVTLRIHRAFDPVAIGKEVAAKDTSAQSAIKFSSRTKVATEPTSATTPQWVAVLWARLDRVIEDVANCCIKVYTLEKVLRLKRDATTHIEFLEEVMKTMDDKPSFSFWTTLAKAFESQSKEAARSSAWLQQALSTGYPRLLRLFHDFFAKIAVHTDTVYTKDHQSPEAVLVLRSVSSFENLYLSRSTTRMNEAVSAALASYLSARGNPPGPAEGVTIARIMTNELDSARFDPLLVRTVARNGARVLDGLVAKIDGMLVKDFTATSLVGPLATPAQTVNGQLVGCLYHCWLNLHHVQQDFPVKVWEAIGPSVNTLQTAYKRITDALDAALRREFASILSRLHKVDFSKPMDPMAMGGGGSRYIQDLLDKLVLVKTEILGKLSMGDFMRHWVLSLTRFMLRTFLFQASIARPMGEAGKLKLTSDMTELEIGLSSFLTTGSLQGGSRGERGGVKLEKAGEEYLALRAFRTLLFSPLASVANPVETVHLQPLIVLHHIVVISPLLLPHEYHGWSEQEYYLWVQKHEEARDQWDLLEKSVDEQVGVGGSGRQVDGSPKQSEGKGVNGSPKLGAGKRVNGVAKQVENGEDGEERYVALIREVLVRARTEEVASPAAT